MELDATIRWIGTLIDAFGVAVIALGVLWATVRVLWVVLRHKPSANAYLRYRQGVGEAHELCIALDTRLQQMLHELVHTDDNAYRDDLHRSLDRLEKIAEKVG